MKTIHEMFVQDDQSKEGKEVTKKAKALLFVKKGNPFNIVAYLFKGDNLKEKAEDAALFYAAMYGLSYWEDPEHHLIKQREALNFIGVNEAKRFDPENRLEVGGIVYVNPKHGNKLLGKTIAYDVNSMQNMQANKMEKTKAEAAKQVAHIYAGEETLQELQTGYDWKTLSLEEFSEDVKRWVLWEDVAADGAEKLNMLLEFGYLHALELLEEHYSPNVWKHINPTNFNKVHDMLAQAEGKQYLEHYFNICKDIEAGKLQI